MVELVVILLVVGILVAILVPAIGTWLEEYRLNIAGQQVVDALQAAKMAAVAKSRRTELVFDVPGNRLGRDGAPLADLPPGVRFSPAGVSTSPDLVAACPGCARARRLAHPAHRSGTGPLRQTVRPDASAL
jgi:type II secretory pathway pseudopilin PulG